MNRPAMQRPVGAETDGARTMTTSTLNAIMRAACLSAALVVTFTAGIETTHAQEVDSAEAIASPGEIRRRAEARRLLRSTARDLGIRVRDLVGSPDRFPAEQNVFLQSTVSVADLDDPDAATATLRLWKGIRPNGEIAHYIITESAHFDVAEIMGLNFAPRMINGVGTEGAMEVTIDGAGRLIFPGDVDFSPTLEVIPGNPDNPDEAFPPAFVQPGAVADALWSSLVVTPAGNVFNVQQVFNSTGVHDRATAIDLEGGTVTLQLLDGFQGGQQYYYHLVTDASAPEPAAIELGVYAPRLANLPTFGVSTPESTSTLFGFSPVVNGITDLDSPERQSLGFTITQTVPGTFFPIGVGDIPAGTAERPVDPINVFPFDPVNNQGQLNNYSPMWDAHLNMWTQEAIDQGLRRRIVSFDDLRNLVEAGLVTSFAENGPSDGFVAGLNSAEAIINCPVIAQPLFSPSVGPAVPGE